MSKNYYNINFLHLVTLLIPPMLRRPVILAFCSSVVRPIISIYKEFINYTEALKFETGSQVCYLSTLLNDDYDYYQRRIIVRDAPINYGEFFLYSAGEGNATILSAHGAGSMIFWTDNGKLGMTVPDFEVVFPLGYVLSESDKKALLQKINNNKLASKKYQIVYE